jgi:hypothetical protein
MVRLSEQKNIAPLLEPQDHNAGVDCDSFHAGRLHSFAIFLQFGELTGNAVLTVESGATAGTKTTAETFNYRVSDAVLKTATGDTYGDWATSASLTLTAATYEDKIIVIEMDSDALTTGQPWVTVALSGAASELFVSVVAVGQPRFEGHDPLTLIS